MKKTLMIAALAASVAAPAFGEVEYELGAGYHSQYNFRGVNFGDDLIDTSVSASFETNGLNITVGAWNGNYTDLTGADAEELDLYLAVSKDVNVLGVDGTVEVGYTNYTFRNVSGFDTDEVYIALSTTTCCGLELGLSYIYDIDLIEEAYAEATAAKSFDVAGVTVDAEIGLAYSFEYTSADNDLNHLWASVAVPYTVSENATLTPYITYISAQDGTEAIGEDSEELVAGVSLAVSF